MSGDARMTYVGPVNSQLYGTSLKKFCSYNRSSIAEASIRVKADKLANQLERARLEEQEEYGYHDDTESICSGTGRSGFSKSQKFEWC